jgi:predicted DNA-binding transcriptional regulator YafY
VTKTERWYAVVEELRAVSPRPRSAQWLADRFEVSRRTIERDLDGLLQAGVPLYPRAGRTGGWVLDRSATLGPPALDTAEVTALAVAVSRLTGTPFAEAGRTAMRKLVGSLAEGPRRQAHESASRVAFLRDPDPAVSVPLAVQRALRDRRVLRVRYGDAAGVVTSREIEPIGFVGSDRWYLVAWCRLRDGVRGFRMDRIRAVEVLSEVAPQRDIDLEATATGYEIELLDPAGNSDNTVSPAR